MPDDLLAFLATPWGSVVIAFVLAYTTAAVAKRKGLPVNKWFAGGLLLGVVALPWVLLKHPNQEELDRRAIRSGEAKRCPQCAELVRPEARACKHCGSGLIETVINAR